MGGWPRSRSEDHAPMVLEEGAVGPMLEQLREHDQRPTLELVVDAPVAVLVADALADSEGEPLGLDRDEPAVEEAVEVGAQ